MLELLIPELCYPQATFLLPTQFRMSTQPDCALGIGILPDFSYNGAGGVSFGTAEFLGESEWKLKFDTENAFCPPLNYATTTIMGLPFPPVW